VQSFAVFNGVRVGEGGQREGCVMKAKSRVERV